MNRWQKVNYSLFLINRNLEDSEDLQEAFLSGYSLAEHVQKHGTPPNYASTQTGLCPEHNRPVNSTGIYYECLCPV